jgi:predicted DCC family thiol-disulfide oxidoreductase YuxK
MPSDLNVATPPAKPVLIFDGDCRFCSRWIRRWQPMTGEAVDYLPSQDTSVAARFPEIPKARFDMAVQLVEIDGQVYSAAEAVLRAMAHVPSGRWPLHVYEASTLVAHTMESFYRLVARHRGFFSRLTGWL